MGVEHVAAIRREGRRLRDIAAGSPATPVPQYPGWSLLDLLVHTGSVHRRTTDVVSGLLMEAPQRTYPGDKATASVIAWYDDGLAAMTAALDDADPTAPVWGFGPAPTVAFWRRRMAIETAIHRRDAEEARGTPRPLDDDVATAGIDEYPDMWLPRLRHEGDRPSGTVALRTPLGAWCLHVEGPGFGMSGGDEPAADAAVSGPVSDVYLWLAARRPARPLDRTGDGALLTAVDDAVARLDRAVL